MPIELNGVIDQSTRLLGTENQKKPLHVGNDGRIEVREPRGTPPGRWTRFKAALINVPLIGRLATVRMAGEEVRIARLQGELRNDFHHAIAGRFGHGVADQAFAGKKPHSALKPLSARRIDRIMRRAQVQANDFRQQNEDAIRRLYPGRDRSAAADCACLWAMATPEYSQRPLQESEIQTVWQAATPLLEALERNGLNPGAVLRGGLDAFTDQLIQTPAGERQQLAARYIASITRGCHDACNRATIARSFPADIAGSSSSPRGPYIRQSDEALVTLLCAGKISPDAPLLSDEAARQAWQGLAEIRAELRGELPLIPAEQIDAAIADVAVGRTSLTLDTLRAMAPKMLIEREMRLKFDPAHRESVFWNAVIEAHGEHQAQKRGMGGSLDENLTTLLTALAKEMMFDIVFGVDKMRERLGGETKLSVVMEALEKQIIGNVKQATKEHLEALDQINQSRTLNAKQKEILKNYAAPAYAEGSEQPRRLDPVQLRRFEIVADVIAGKLPRMQQATKRGDPAAIYDCVRDIRTAFMDGYREILDHAGEMWVSRNFSDNATENEILELCMNLALAKYHAAGRSGTPNTPRRLNTSQELPSTPESRPSTPEVRRKPASGTQPSAHRSDLPAAKRPSSPQDAPPDAEPGAAYADAVRQMAYACGGSPLPDVAKLGMFYGSLLRLSGADDVNVEEAAPEPLYRMRPELLARTLADPNSDPEASQLDKRGVYTDPKFRNLIARDYDPVAVFDPEIHFAALAPSQYPPGGRAEVLGHVLAGADVILNNTHLALDPPPTADPVRSASQSFEAFAKAYGPGVGEGVLTCLASSALQSFSAAIDAAAFDPRMDLEHQRDVHEIWRDAHGDCYVRSTRVSQPRSQGGEQLDADAIVLCTMTHRIANPANAQRQGAPVLDLAQPPKAVIMLTEPRRADAD
jgi:hypothetical protein